MDACLLWSQCDEVKPPDLLTSPAHPLQSPSPASPTDAVPVQDETPKDILVPQPQVPSTCTLPLFDMELLHHYTTSTCYTLSCNTIVQAIWRDEAPRVGFSMPAVLHALLAVSALHLAHLHPARRAPCLSHAHMHHTTAVQLVTPHLPSLASENGVGLFLFSALTCIFACSATATECGLFAEQGRPAEWVRLIRGMKTVIEHSSRDFLTTPLRPMFVYGSRLTTTSSFEDLQTTEQGREFTSELRQAIYREFQHDPQLCHIYRETLDGLSKTLGVAMASSEGSPKLQTGDVFAWILELSDEYLDLLLRADPFALVIFAHFCVALRQIEWMWWTEGLSRRLLVQIYHLLEERYHRWMTWPEEQIAL
ncbi:hypothetical protein BJY00DRAFT_297810 [Aspergillus carlsbadensis]|nr:hypothetical protein BJY00DRAFT_297810 [Aspergillus carlsbadensis]